MIMNDQELEKCLMGDLIQFGEHTGVPYRTYITIHSDSHGESITGPMSNDEISDLISSLLDVGENIEINIKKIFSKS